MSLETLVANATEDELRVVATVLERANAKPAIVVTLTDRKRYVVAQEDEHLFDKAPDGATPQDFDGRTDLASVRMGREYHLGRFGFGAQWLRGYGRVDEMYRSLDTYEITKVARVDRAKVWGR